MAGSSSTAPKIMVFRPTMEEFKEFSKYIEKMESMGAHKAGLAKIIPPEGWCPRKGGYDDIDLMIPAPISQVVTGRQGLYQQYNVQQKAMHVQEFKVLAESSARRTPPHFDYEDIERKYWKNITFNPPIYGADVSGSLYDDNVEEFNIQHLNTILDMVKEDYEIKIEGVNTAYLYFGMWKTTFAWHTEDMDLYSINYLHFGAPKSWYVVPPEHGRRLERMAAQFFHGSSSLCSAFLRHKMTIIAPHVLKTYSIPFSKITQEPGEFMITFPFAYHSGFNHGFNCAESTNFALPRWVEYGKRSSHCTCRNDCVKICMDVFVSKFQPERYELWLNGKDYGQHPEDPSRTYPAPPPNKLELALSLRRQEEKKKSKEKIKQRRQPVTRVRKSSLKEEQSSDDESEKCVSNKSSKKKRARRNPPIKNSMLIDEKSLNIDDSTCDILQTKLEEIEKPPELKPFWDPEGDKAKQEADIDPKDLCEVELIETEPKDILEVELKEEEEEEEPEPKDESMLIDEDTEITSNIYYQDKQSDTSEILDKYPMLKIAIDTGALSLNLADGENEVKPKQEDDCIDMHQKGVENSDLYTKFSDMLETKVGLKQSWSCEQTTNGIKIKLISSKENQADTSPKVSNSTELSFSEYFSKTPDKSSIDNKDSDDSPTSKSIECSPPEKETNPKVKRAANTKDNWAHHLAGLWQHEDFDFRIECSYNQKLASITPHCAICVIFSPLLDKDSFLSGSNSVPSSSIVKMPAFCYGDSLNNECIIDTNSLLITDGCAPLLTCATCNVCVHAPCYGVTTLPEGSWKCSRCSEGAINVQCCLCVLRGGALKRTADGRWAHIICAILISETYCENTLLKEPINVSNITPTRLRLKCKYCMKAHSHKDRRGACVQCQSGRCYLPFHATCGYMAGVIFEFNDWPEPINMICTKHASARRKPHPRQFTNVSVGESVIAKHKNRRYYWANVKNKYVQEYYSILFEDNSHSTNTLPEDIVSKDVSSEGPPNINEKVKVKWTDGKIYNGIFKGSQSVDLFVVEFDDGTIQHQERRQIFAADEDLPKEVQSKMSHSSEGKGPGISDIKGKRQRLFNQRYCSV